MLYIRQILNYAEGTKMKSALLLAIGLALAAFDVRAANEVPELKEGVQSFQQSKDAWRRSEQENQPVFLPGIADSIGAAAAINIEQAEQVFCYEVDARAVDYDGYTIDGMALTGICGVLNPELKKLVLQELFMSPQNVILDKNENCIIKPKIMLRFVRGVDNTDVLLSSPCYSYSVFYGGKVRPFNAKPAAEIIDALINPLLKKKVKFVSPALLNQLLPVGVAQTEEQKELVSKKNKPIRGWETEEASEAQAPAKTRAASGWNKLNK